MLEESKKAIDETVKDFKEVISEKEESLEWRQQVQKPIKVSNWLGFKNWMYKYIGTLFMETKDHTNIHQMSIGRVLLAISSGFAIYTWMSTGKDIPGGMQTFIMTMAGYVVGGKIATAVKAIRGPRGQ